MTISFNRVTSRKKDGLGKATRSAVSMVKQWAWHGAPRASGVSVPLQASTQLMADHGAKLLVAKAHGHPEKVFQDHPDRLQAPVTPRGKKKW